MLTLYYAFLGVVLGWLRPPLALAVLVGAVSVTSSLWWQLGFANVAGPLAFLSAFFVGLGVRAGLGNLRVDEPSGPTAGPRDPIHVACLLTIVFVLAASFLGVLRRHAPGMLAVDAPITVRSLFTFNPGGLAGEIQATLVAIMGPLLVLAGLQILRSTRSRTVLVRALLAGTLVAVVAPLLQWLFLNPWVRPDRDADTATGFVGFSQDPHSYAAYLVLAVGIAAGASLAAARSSNRAASATYASLAALATLVLLGTNSKTALIALIVAAIFMVSALRFEKRAAQPTMAPVPWPLVVLLATALVSTLAIATIGPLRQATYDGLRELGARRMAQPLDPAADWNQLLGDRQQRWPLALAVIGQRPLWGAGPRSIAAMPLGAVGDPASGTTRVVPPENTHNYYLQFAAEYGIPAALALIWLIGLCFARAATGIAQQPSAPTRGLLVGIVSGQVGFLVIGLASHPMLLAEGQAVFWTATALAVCYADEGVHSTHSNGADGATPDTRAASLL